MKILRKIPATAALIIALFLFNACNCIEGEGPRIEEMRDVDYFNKIELRMSADVYLKQDSNLNVQVRAQQNILEVLETRVDGKKLIIDTKGNCVRTSGGVEVFISLPMLESLEVDGSGSFSSTGSFTLDNIDLEINGSGDIQLDLIANRIDTDISGSGSVRLSGTAQSHKIDITGSGNVSAFELTSYRAGVDVSGSGDCELQVHKKLDVKISGSGNVYYKGSPDIKTRVSGSGSVDKH